MDTVFLVATVVLGLFGLILAFYALTLFWLKLHRNCSLSSPPPSLNPLWFPHADWMLGGWFAIGVLHFSHFWDFTSRHVDESLYWAVVLGGFLAAGQGFRPRIGERLWRTFTFGRRRVA